MNIKTILFQPPLVFAFLSLHQQHHQHHGRGLFYSSQLRMSSSINEKTNRVVVVGSANQDLTSYTPTVPVLGETVLGSSFDTSSGGKGANQARAASGLSISPVSMICRVGNDVFGESLLRGFRKVGIEVDTDNTVVENTSSGVAAIIVDEKSGDNMIIVTPGANYALQPSDVDASLRSLKPKVVLVQLEIPYECALQALKTGRELGAVTILNPAPAPEDKKLDDFFPHVDILIPNETELRTLCGEAENSELDEQIMAKRLLSMGVQKSVICTLGARGAMIVQKSVSNDDQYQVDFVDAPLDLPARKEKVLDTIGAGDGFCGSLSVYLSVDLDLKDAVSKSCGFASMSVRRRGASYPTAAELPESLRVPASNQYMNQDKTKAQITFVTGNKKKLEEVKQILADGDGNVPFDIINDKIDLPELQGDPIDIAKEKCILAAQKIQGACFVEDTSLCFNALNGMPGPYIKFFLEKCGHDGLNRMLAGYDDKTAYAQTIIAFCPGPGQDVCIFDGQTQGQIVQPRGSLDFGWDPIFQPNESDGLTYAEMEKIDKNKISHRGRAMEKFRTYLVEQADEIQKIIQS